MRRLDGSSLTTAFKSIMRMQPSGNTRSKAKRRGFDVICSGLKVLGLEKNPFGSVARTIAKFGIVTC